MGQCLSGQQSRQNLDQRDGSSSRLILKLPKLYSPSPLLTREEVETSRNEFWETCWAYGGSREIWEALHKIISLLYEGNAEAATELASAAELTIPENDIGKGAYDSKGTFYEIPKIVARIPRAFAEKEESDDEQANPSGSLEDGKFPEEKGTGTQVTSVSSLDDGEKSEPLEPVIIRYCMDERDYTIQLNSNAPLLQAKPALAEAGLDTVQRLFFLGRILQWKKALRQQGWSPGMVIQAM
ncbi:ubiquitin family protein [Schizosaccharomyces cryophilus OY26]|uniref:Ubiquitin family protein n=1 Tax=Schizosaccharomyces cryophilus (strain OY26 / ATCC MYA-4695 / CBS 11777 / NBRC 106824 / NRRL Y48691) TaxID=653667 RepID=S9VZS4_SCHCR|nr:ubiquitin family protein [Schizosaccharomyces cryophilus OY26]EPY53193.1 ubiquitin family protein [Schizosaccharomyces cryophilus OY26]